MSLVRIGNIAVDLTYVCCVEDRGDDGVVFYFASRQPSEVVVKGEAAKEAREFMEVLPKGKDRPYPSPVVAYARPATPPVEQRQATGTE